MEPSHIRGFSADVASCARYIDVNHYMEKPLGRWTIAEVKRYSYSPTLMPYIRTWPTLRVLTQLYSTSVQADDIDGPHNAWIVGVTRKSFEIV